MDTEFSRLVIVRNTFREYMQSCSEFWTAFQRCTIAIKCSERQRQALQTHLRLQTLWLARQRLRFEYLLRGRTFETGFWGELDNITQRLDKEWSDNEETDLLASEPTYRDLLVEIEDLVPKMNGAELDAPIKALQQNAQYREARELMADEVQRLNKLLSTT
jgi:exonuclease VII small subunit/putative component of membrane protein insertase Oxa1/YidC/SpoIIIJ protein YidD